MTARVDPAVLARALAPYGADPASCRFLGGFESQVFEARYPGGALVLKLGDPGHRSPDAVEAECEWLEFLTARGVPAAPPIRAADGRYAALLGEPGEAVCARAYVKAPGAPLQRKGAKSAKTQIQITSVFLRLCAFAPLR
ncbi:phosphotransferase [Sorangium sp. So ce296]|uniref:phosphotransferase n=1 Tax=Sorangium sp. So ce296 TaxID=3133296 RepID=UPI003F5F66E2